jgi:hypothetical protein
MSHVDKMAEHLAAYETWQKKCAEIEAEARVRVRRQHAGRPASAQFAQTSDEYFVTRDLDGDFWYKRAQSSRNGHQQACLMYGIAALVERMNVEVTR